MTSKIMAFEDKPCASCMLYVKVYSREEVQLSIHAQSIYAQIDLKEGQPLTDVVAANETNRYIITSTKNKEVILNIHIISGNVKVELSDYLRVSVTKENTHGNSNIHIVVPSKDLKTEKAEKTDSVAPIPYYMSAFAMSNFVNLHLTVTSQKASEPANFIITYSNGGQSTYLEDGLISEYTLMAKKEYKFLYNTPSYAEPIYLYISAPDALTLSNLHPKIYGLENEGDEENRMELTP